MRFADKLFVLMAVLLGIIFSAFGLWMLNSNFSNILSRELDRGEKDNQMFQYMFEMGYQSNKSYGGDYAINKSLDSIVGNISGSGSYCFVLNSEKEYIYYSVREIRDPLLIVFSQLIESLEEGENYAGCVREIEDMGHFAINICSVSVDGATYYLGSCRSISTIYSDRTKLITEYRIAIIALLIIGGVCIYIFARFITAPMQKLEEVASDIAEGDYNKRAEVVSEDEVGELAESFNMMTDALVREMKEREDFTTAFAHELKTPLTSIIGYADMLNTMKMTEEESREAYYYIYSQGKRLESLSHKLLDLVSMDKNPIKFSTLSVRELGDNILTTMRPIWEKKEIKGKISLGRGKISGDKELLLSLFYNLLDNAVKAVEPGGVVMMKGKQTEDGYEVRIVDNGRGIPEEEISRITEAFYMVDKSRSRKEGGAGIGMALCKKIIELHNGEFSVQSKLGVGTAVTIVFAEKGAGNEIKMEAKNKARS